MTSVLFEFDSLTSVAIRSIALLGLTLVVAIVLRARSAAFVHGIWAVALSSLLVMPIVIGGLPGWDLPVLPSQIVDDSTVTNDPILNAPGRRPEAAPLNRFAAQPSVFDGPHEGVRQSTAKVFPTDLTVQPALNPPTTTIPDTTVRWPSLATMALLGWGAVASALVLRLAKQLLDARRCVLGARAVDDEAWLRLRDDAARALDLRNVVELKSHTCAISPMVVGLLKPTVLLPADADGWPAERRTLVLLHELAHVKRRDVLTQTVAAFSCALYWFNPLAWWGATQMKRLREIACDDAVIAHSGVPASYAQTLLEIAKGYRRQPMLGAVAMARTHHVEGRIMAILNARRNRAALSGRGARLLAAASLAVVVVVGTCQLATRAGDPAEKQPEPKASEPAATPPKAAPKLMTVRVLDASGRPLANAKVHASIWEMEGEPNFPTRDFETDEEGRAMVARPERLKILRLWPYCDGFVPQFVNFAEGMHDDGRLLPDEYEFRLQKGHRIGGCIVDADGKPIAGAHVQVDVAVDEPNWSAGPKPMISRWLAEGDAAAVTDATGHWEITNAPAPREADDYDFRLLVTHPDFVGDMNWGELQRQQGIGTSLLRNGKATIKLDRGIAVTGAITGPDGAPVTKGIVIWDDRPYWATGDNETQIDANGRFETKRFAPGTRKITVLAPGYAPEQKTIDVVQSPEGVMTADFQLAAGRPIRIKIIDESGNPVPKASVSIGEWRGTEAIYNMEHPNVLDSGIPRQADEKGVFAWDWAPADGVQYRIDAKGFDTKEVKLVAKPDAHEVVIVRPVTIYGKVTDAQTGKPVAQFRAIPVKAFRPDFYSTDFQTGAVVEGVNGEFRLPIESDGQVGNRYRVRIEADGYRTAFGERDLAVGDPPLEENFRLEPAPADVAEVIGVDGQPVADFTVAIGGATTAPHFSLDRPESSFGKSFHVQGKHQFELAASFEPELIRVFNDEGFAETLHQPGTPIGTLRLQPWGSVSGRLMQGDRPIVGEGIYFHPLVQRGLTEARFQDSYYATTDGNGPFRFDRLPPISGNVTAYLGPWRESPLTSSQVIPMELKPGQHSEVTLGGLGASVAGRVVATGRENDDLSKQWSLNYLVSRERGVAWPSDAAPLSFDATGPVQPAWLRQPDFQNWLATRSHHFVKLADDGTMQIHGVEPGEYDLVIQLYEQPAGCLVETIGEKVMPLSITAEQTSSGVVQIGDVEVECRTGPRVGSDMRAFQFADADGQIRNVDDLGGRYVLLHAWATWCVPCMQSMPNLKSTVEQFSEKPLTVVGLNLDEDATAAKATAEREALNWAQNYLGADSDLMRQLAISSVPAYYLIGPDGKLVGSASEWEQIEELLKAQWK